MVYKRQLNTKHVNRCYSIKTLPFYLKKKYVSSGVSRGLAAKGTIHYDCP